MTPITIDTGIVESSFIGYCGADVLDLRMLPEDMSMSLYRYVNCEKEFTKPFITSRSIFDQLREKAQDLEGEAYAYGTQEVFFLPKYALDNAEPSSEGTTFSDLYRHEDELNEELSEVLGKGYYIKANLSSVLDSSSTIFSVSISDKPAPTRIDMPCGNPVYLFAKSAHSHSEHIRSGIYDRPANAGGIVQGSLILMHYLWSKSRPITDVVPHYNHMRSDIRVITRDTLTEMQEFCNINLPRLPYMFIRRLPLMYNPNHEHTACGMVITTSANVTYRIEV